MLDLRKAEHLPNVRGGEPPQRDWLPRQRRGVTPQMIGRYPDFDVLESAAQWDAATRAVVLARVEPLTRLRFFSSEELPALRTLCDVLLAQDSEPRVPVVELVDAKLAEGRLDGFRYEDMPDDRETWRRVLAALDATAWERHEARLADCEAEQQEALVEGFAQGRLRGAQWQGLNVSRAWSVCTRMAMEAFYSHPWAWNEIGFGGPAYPRGFMRMGPLAVLEPHERPGATDEDPVRVAQRL